MSMKKIGAACGLLLTFCSVSIFAAPPPPTQKEALKPEISDEATLPPAGPHRFFNMGYGSSIVIYDADAEKIEGQVPVGHDGNLALSPDDSRIYITETVFTHGNRGARLDLFSIYDSTTLHLLKEIELPGRALVGYKLRNLDISSSGKRAYIYNMRPAGSVLYVNLATQTVGASIETPGCAMVFAWGEEGVSSLCGDGSLATITMPEGGPPQITHSKPFFDANNDPIFDNSLIDHTTNTAVFMTYTGLIYTVKLGAEPVIDKPWSLQEAAGQKRAGTGVDELAWRPGGVQPIAWHKRSDRLFVLMHPGNYWSHITGATEIWVVNLKTHAVIARYASPQTPEGPIKSIAVTQKDKPQIILPAETGGNVILDADTGEEVKKLEHLKGAVAIVPGT